MKKMTPITPLCILSSIGILSHATVASTFPSGSYALTCKDNSFTVQTNGSKLFGASCKNEAGAYLQTTLANALNCPDFSLYNNNGQLACSSDESPQWLPIYEDDFDYQEGSSALFENDFNRWYWAHYTQGKQDAVTYNFTDSCGVHNDKTCASFSINKNYPTTPGWGSGAAGATGYIDAEMFDNACIKAIGGFGTTNSPIQPNQNARCSSPFPYGVNVLIDNLPNVTDSYAEGYLVSDAVGTTWLIGNKTKYVPYLALTDFSNSTQSVRVNARIKAEGLEQGSRGWGFWNTATRQTPGPSASGASTTGNPFFINDPAIQIAWFYEYAIDINDSPSNLNILEHIRIKSNETNDLVISLLFAMTANFAEGGGGACISLLGINTNLGHKFGANLFDDKFHDYKVTWSPDFVEYKIDETVVAVHKASEKAVRTLPGELTSGDTTVNSVPVNTAMAFHNWVDNRIIRYRKSAGQLENYHPTLKKTKTNLISSFKSERTTQPLTPATDPSIKFCTPIPSSNDSSLKAEDPKTTLMKLLHENLEGIIKVASKNV